MMNFGPFESILLFLILAFLYIIPFVFIVYWMLKMLKNSNEQLRISKEILEKLNIKND